jgi:hypothetical protein
MEPPKPAKRPRDSMGGPHPGAEYTDSELEVLLWVDRYKRRWNRPYPSIVEILDIIRWLGWKEPDRSEEQRQAGDDGDV